MSTGAQLPLQDITEDGKPPVSRLSDPAAVADLVEMLARGDADRNRIRAKVKGIIDGNPPYSPAMLRSIGQSYRTNINFREAEAFFSVSLTAFYDIFSETPTYATIRTNTGNNDSERAHNSRIITEEFDRLQKKDKEFDYTMQLSQHEMVLYGSGPLTFENPTSWRARAIKAGDLLVPEGTRSNPTDWEVAVVRRRYQPHELFRHIQNEEAAAKVGWNVDMARQAIIDSGPEEYRKHSNWEWHQQRMRNNDIHYSSKCSAINCAYVYVKEYPQAGENDGKISCFIIKEGGSAFLYKKIGKHENWNEVLHPMYYDKGDGEHHSVKGLGVKMYPIIELKNRQKCHMIDVSATASSMQLQAENPESAERANIIQMGPYNILPSGFKVVQRQFSGIIDAPISVDRELENVLQSNTSQYRQRIDNAKGNPKTATEVQATVQQASVLGKTQIARYYYQLDQFFEERFRRAANPSVTDRDAMEFQRRIVDRGVPKEALTDIDYVQATRNYGQGSAFLRLQTVSGLMQISSQLPESGRQALIRDYIAALAGQQQVGRYLVEPDQDVYAKDQVAEANVENSVMQIGNPVILTDSQNHSLHLQTHIDKGDEIAQMAGAGGSPPELGAFLGLIVSHSQEHLAELAANPERKPEVDMFSERLNQLAAVLQQLQAAAQSQAEQEQQQQEQLRQPTDGDLKLEEMTADQARKDAAHRAELQRMEDKHRMEMAHADARAAQDVLRN